MKINISDYIGAIIDFIALLIGTFVTGIAWWGLFNFKFSMIELFSNIIITGLLGFAYYWFFTRIVIIKIRKK